MIRELLVMLTQDATWTLPELADRLRTDQHLAKMALEECARLGYAVKVPISGTCAACTSGGCGGGCCGYGAGPTDETGGPEADGLAGAACAPRVVTPPGRSERPRRRDHRTDEPGWWQLTAAGRAAAGRYLDARTGGRGKTAAARTDTVAGRSADMARESA